MKKTYSLIALLLFFAAANAQYCIPAGNDPSLDFVDSFQVGTDINNPPTTLGYSDFTATTFTTLKRTLNYPVTIIKNSTDDQGVAVWIDYNQDGDFDDAGELVVNFAQDFVASFSGSFTVPVTALTGTTRMRVLLEYQFSPGVGDACRQFIFGETEDYTVEIEALPYPGNVISNLQLWMRADAGTTLTGTDVDAWEDQSPNQFSAASQGTADAQLITDGLNFNPTLRFSGTQFLNLGNQPELDLQPLTDEMTIITVINTTSFGTVVSKGDEFDRNYQVWSGFTDRALHHTLGRATGDPTTSTRFGTLHIRNEPKITSGVVANTGSSLTRLTPYMNGVVDVAATNEGISNGNIAADVLIGARRASGNTGTGFLFRGDIAEVIIYDRDLTTTELEKVESYLAIKYGITLGANEAFWDTPTVSTSPTGYAGTSKNYLDSNGTVIWNGTTNAGYGFNVFGIGRDDNSGLIQTQSNSVNVDVEDILTMELESGTFATNRSFLMVGSNGLAETIQTTTLPARTMGILNKVWLARETAADVGTVELRFDMSASGVPNLDDLELYIASNDSFSDYENYEGTNVGGIITFTGVNLSSGQYFTLAEPEVIMGDNALFFDGIDDYVEDRSPATRGLTDYTVMGWVKNPGQSSTIADRRILGVAGQYKFFLNSGLLGFQEGQTGAVGQTGSSTIRDWVHFAIIVDTASGRANFYLNGRGAGGGGIDPLASNTNPFRMGTESNVNFFTGSIDEVRIFDVALTLDQLREMVHQEIEQNGANVMGSVIPKDIEDFTTGDNVPWSSLVAYYDMSSIKGNRIEDVTGNDNTLFMKNINAVEPQTAPMPYTSIVDGNWGDDATWEFGSVWDIPSAASINWSIVEIKNDVTVNANYSTLGLTIDPGATLTVTGTNPIVTNTSPFAATRGTGFELINTWYAEINGIIDLNGESQFRQTSRSDLAITSAGYVEKDQQGTANNFTYNYWSSPVSEINTTANNQDFALQDVFLDGTTASSPGAISWTIPANADGSTSPFTISSRWIYKFVNGGDEDYDAWLYTGNAGNISVGEGFTMKGVSSTSDELEEQNYVFRGKPNNGTITVGPLGDTNLYLVGNPYLSVLDANQFIADNLANDATSGTLYFWEHWGGGTHTLLEYQGGYATYTTLGGTPAMSHPTVNQTDSGTKTPGRFIPVGQGFFVQGDSNAGNGVTTTVEFNNGQRGNSAGLIREYGSSPTSVFVRDGVDETLDPGMFENPENTTNTSAENIESDDDPSADDDDIEYDEDGVPVDTRQKIRLGYINPEGFRRQILLGFDENSTDGIDLGYDGESIGVTANDMYWSLENQKYVIQALPDFNIEREVAIGLATETAGGGTITLDGLENIDNTVGIYIKDNYTGITHDLRASDFQVSIPAGNTDDKYSLVFKPENALSINTEILENGITMYTDTETEEVVITNNTNFKLEVIDIHTILGQKIISIKEGIDENTIRIPIDNQASGIYVISIYSEQGKISKKLVIQ